MTKPVKEVSCPGCQRTGQTTDPRRYCRDCRENLRRQQCDFCETAVITDVPYVLCDECQAEGEQWEALYIEASNDG